MTVARFTDSWDGNIAMSRIFEYSDYHPLLADIYEERKKANVHFSHRFIAGKLGITAGYVTKILQGQRDLSHRLVPRIVEFFGFKKKEAEYFEALVAFNHSKTHTDKKRSFEKLLSLKPASIRLVSLDQYELFDKWYYLAIREIIAVFPVNDDAEALAKLVAPQIKPAEAKKALELLNRLELIRKDNRGHYRPVDPVWSTGTETRSVALNNFHISSLDLAKQAFDRFPREKRNMSTLTLSISQADYSWIEEEMVQFRRKLLDRAGKAIFPDRVYHFNFSVFPLSSTRESTYADKKLP
jgi:uncharacterized protein (TIGR02147 family)